MEEVKIVFAMGTAHFFERQNLKTESYFNFSKAVPCYGMDP
jgi:hypothetical protein